MQTKIQEARDYIKLVNKDPNKTFSIIGNIYETRPTIGEIRADMIDSIYKSMDKKIKDPLIVGLDADTYKLSDNYVEGVVKSFDNNPNASYFRGTLRWTDSSVHNYAHLSERLMQSFYSPYLENSSGYINSSGGSTSFRLNTYKKIGGYNRKDSIGEDTNLGEKLSKKGKEGKVYVSPRRGEQALENGKKFSEQWDSDFKPVDESKIDRTVYEKTDKLINKFKTGGTLNKVELQDLENIINSHINGNEFALRKFSKMWNITAKNSFYKLKIVGDKIIIEEKKIVKNEVEIKPNVKEELYKKYDIKSYVSNGKIDYKKLIQGLNQFYHPDKLNSKDPNYNTYTKIFVNLNNIKKILDGKKVSKSMKEGIDPYKDLIQMATNMELYLKSRGII